MSGILFNHEIQRRGLEFVTRKITDGAARIKLGLARELRLGNLDSRRDWGYAGDYVRAMWQCFNRSRRRITSSRRERRTVWRVLRAAFKRWGSMGAVRRHRSRLHPAGGSRPADGRCVEAREKLGWSPEVSFEELVRMMVEAVLRPPKCAMAPEMLRKADFGQRAAARGYPNAKKLDSQRTNAEIMA